MNIPNVYLHTQQLSWRSAQGWLNIICTTNSWVRHYIEKGGELEKLSGIWENSQGSEVLVSPTVCSLPQPSWCRLQLGPGLYPTFKANKCILGQCCQCLIQAQPARPPGHHLPWNWPTCTWNHPAPHQLQPWSARMPGCLWIGCTTGNHDTCLSSLQTARLPRPPSTISYTEVTPTQSHSFKFKRGSSFI